MKKIREWISIKTAKAPGTIVLLAIFIANVAIIGVSGFIISALAPPSLENSGFWSSVYHTITMILGIGGVENVIEDIGQAEVIYVLCCIAAVIIGMIVFTGAIIGYMTDFISGFIESADSSSRRLDISDHIIILNWNTRAAEIVNELLYKNTKEKIVVLVENNREDILKDIEERLADTIEHENVKNKLTIIVREGDSSSTKQLNDISIKSAKSIIILSADNSGAHEFGGYNKELIDRRKKSDVNIIKVLLQVAHMTSQTESVYNQQVVVEVEDDRTLTLVETVIEQKMRKGNCNIIPVAANQILGQIFSQFSIMPELNIVYNTLFSNKGVSLYVKSSDKYALDDNGFISEFLENHFQAIPLAVIHDEDGKYYRYFMSDTERHIDSVESIPRNNNLKVSLNPDFQIKDKHIIILGHNSKSAAIMEGFKAFCGEWGKKDGPEILDVIMIDDEPSLAKHGHYEKYPFVKKVIAADFFDKDTVCGVIGEFIGAYKKNGCIIILSDDTVPDAEIDADALTYLVLVQDIINSRLADDPGFDPKSLDLVVEILNPKNYDIVSNYSTNNIVISNRYISKMIMQIGEKEAIYNFYDDILNYEEPEEEVFISKELYIKKASEFFNEIPGPCTAAELIRAVYHASPDENKAIVLGYFCPGGEMILFKGDQSKIHVSLSDKDKLIIFSNH